MKIGKLPNEVLDRLILEPIKKWGVKRDEALTAPSVGEDCAALKFGSDICMLSTDPITGAAENIGALAVYINSNDIASAGGEVIGLMVTTLLPPDITEAEISAIAESLYKSANAAGVAILGGHTEITDAVTRPIISCTAVGRGKRFISSGGARVGDSVIMTKYAAIEGSSIIYADYKGFWQEKLTDEEKAACESFASMLSAVPEGAVAAEMGASSMHDVTEGGVLGACYEIAECAGVGITVYEDKIPILPVTKKMCEICGVNPLRLISSGSMLITSANGGELVGALEGAGIRAAEIGIITDGERLVEKNGELMPLAPPETDELYGIADGMKNKM